MPLPLCVGYPAADTDADRPVVEGDAGAGYYALMTEVLHAVLLRKGVLTAADTDRVIATLEAPTIAWGARLVATAWRDPAYRDRLLANGAAAAAELGFQIREAQLVALPNTPTLHNVIVCTLCSCYPRSLLGQPPWWYISKNYRARTVREPRAVLAEFGLHFAPEVEVRVHDSNADLRYIVLPLRPAGTEGWSQEALAALVTTASLIGVAVPHAPPTAPCQTAQ